MRTHGKKGSTVKRIHCRRFGRSSSTLFWAILREDWSRGARRQRFMQARCIW